jgi:hypothetical protein
MFLNIMQEDKETESELNGSKHSPNLFCSYPLHACNSDLLSVVPRCLNFATSSKDLFTIFMLCFCPIFWLRDINSFLLIHV